MQRVSAIAISGSAPGWVLGELAEGMLTLHFIPRDSNATEGSILHQMLTTQPALLSSLLAGLDGFPTTFCSPGSRAAAATYEHAIVCRTDEPEAEPTQEQIFTTSEDF